MFLNFSIYQYKIYWRHLLIFSTIFWLIYLQECSWRVIHSRLQNFGTRAWLLYLQESCNFFTIDFTSYCTVSLIVVYIDVRPYPWPFLSFVINPLPCFNRKRCCLKKLNIMFTQNATTNFFSFLTLFFILFYLYSFHVWKTWEVGGQKFLSGSKIWRMAPGLLVLCFLLSFICSVFQLCTSCCCTLFFFFDE